MEVIVVQEKRVGTPNIRNQRLATLDFPPGPILSRVRCIAWFAIFYRWAE
jgi:hypothetical protein